MDLSFLPGVNAALNATAVVLLIVGRRLAREQRFDAHRRVMIAAFAVSSLFLVLYVAHKTSRGFVNTAFHAEGAALVAYRVMLFTHVVLAMTVPVLAIALVALGVSGRRERHRRLARFAWPVWVYVSVTGVLIYLLLYHAESSPGCSSGFACEFDWISSRCGASGVLWIGPRLATTPRFKTQSRASSRGRVTMVMTWFR